MLADILSMFEYFRLLFQGFLLLLIVEHRFCQLLILETPIVLVLVAPFRRLLRFLQLSHKIPPLAVSLSVVGQERCVGRYDVEHFNLESFVVEQQVLML